MAEIVRKTVSLNDPLHVGFVRTYFVDGKEVGHLIKNMAGHKTGNTK